MNWRYETWRKLYVREEGSFAALSYSARSCAAMLLKLCDNRGRIYGRAGEDVISSILFRLGADRGERRTIREALTELVADGYLLQGEGWLRIKNFHRAQGTTDAEVGEAATVQRPCIDEVATVSPSSTEPVTTVSRRCSDEDVNVSRPCIDEVATVSRPCIEERVNYLEGNEFRSDVPSVPFLPSEALPSTEEEGALLTSDPLLSSPETGARDPVAPPPGWGGKPRYRSGYAWLEAFKLAWRERYQVFYGNGSDGRAASDLTDLLVALPEDEAERLWKRREEAFELFLARCEDRLTDARHPFAFFVARFTDFRPDVQARASPAVTAREAKTLANGQTWAELKRKQQDARRGP